MTLRKDHRTTRRDSYLNNPWSRIHKALAFLTGRN